VPRVKRGPKRRAYRHKTLERASGFFLTKSKLNRAAQEAVEKALRYGYVGRRRKKRDFRSLWIIRIGAACRAADISYSRFISGLKKAGVELNRKILADLAASDEAAFRALVEQAKAANVPAWRIYMNAAQQQKELDSLSHLEERITRAVELVNTLRDEKAGLESQLASASAENDALRQELDELRSERRQVRTRIEKLLGQMESLNGA
jgi:large subunit ribosomal protein L20